MIPKFLKKVSDKRFWVKEGYIALFLFFPELLEDDFATYLTMTLGSLKHALSDENEKI
jgi:hypothetical protein